MSRCRDCEQSTSGRCWRHHPAVQVGPNATGTGEMTLTKDTDPVELARELAREFKIGDQRIVIVARAVLELAEAWITCPACGETWGRKDGTETHDDVCQQRDAARAEVERLRGALETLREEWPDCRIQTIKAALGGEVDDG